MIMPLNSQLMDGDTAVMKSDDWVQQMMTKYN